MENTKNANQNNIGRRTIIFSVLFIITIIVVMIVAAGCNANEAKVQPSVADKPDDITEEAVTAQEPKLSKQAPKLPGFFGVTITKSDITKKATFFPFEAEGTYMEVIAIRASDGTVRTALNTCQVCTGSGRGYYAQEGDVLVCKNCGNRFTVDQVEVVKGGCNPVPIFAQNKTEDDESITISSDYLIKNKTLFYNWKI